MSVSESWGTRAYGDPCRECAFEWRVTADAASSTRWPLTAAAGPIRRLGATLDRRPGHGRPGAGGARLGPQPVLRVARVHFVDMVVHRWDLSRGLGRHVPTPDFLVNAALPVARSITTPGSPLVGRGRPCRESTIDADQTHGLAPVEILAGLLGRDPEWDRG